MNHWILLSANFSILFCRYCQGEIKCSGILICAFIIQTLIHLVLRSTFVLTMIINFMVDLMTSIHIQSFLEINAFDISIKTYYLHVTALALLLEYVDAASKRLSLLHLLGNNLFNLFSLFLILWKWNEDHLIYFGQFLSGIRRVFFADARQPIKELLMPDNLIGVASFH